MATMREHVMTPLFAHRLAEIGELAKRVPEFADLKASLSRELGMVLRDDRRGSSPLVFRGWGHDLSDCQKTYVRHKVGDASVKPKFRVVWRELDDGRIEFVNFGLRQDEKSYQEAAEVMGRPKSLAAVGTVMDMSPTSAPVPDLGVPVTSLFAPPAPPVPAVPSQTKIVPHETAPATHAPQSARRSFEPQPG